MVDSSWFARLEQVRTSYLLIGLLLGGLRRRRDPPSARVSRHDPRARGPAREGGDPDRVPALGVDARLGNLAALPDARPRFPDLRRRGRRVDSRTEDPLRTGPAVHGGDHVPCLHDHRPGARGGGAGIQGRPQPTQGPVAGDEPGAVRKLCRDPAADRLDGGRDRGLRAAQPGALRIRGTGLVSGRGSPERAHVHRFRGLCDHEDPEPDGRARPGQVASCAGGRDGAAGEMARLDPPGGVQALLHIGPGPSDLGLVPARQAAGGHHHGLLEPAPADPRAGPQRPAGLRQRGDRPAPGLLEIDPDADQGAARPVAADPGDDRAVGDSYARAPPDRPPRARQGGRRLGPRPSPGRGDGVQDRRPPR